MAAKIDLTGMTFGRLTVVREERDRRNGHVYWLCSCSCGKEKSIAGVSLRRGASNSCGCRVVESNVRRSKHGMSRSSVFSIWKQMIGRCDAGSTSGHRNYAGRGITVCDRWADSFENFYADMGPRPSPSHSIDRTNNNAGYSPDNCRWATRAEQSLNSRVSRVWVVDGVEYESSSSAAKSLSVNQSTICRWCNGYTVGGRFVEPRNGCSSYLKYEEQ